MPSELSIDDENFIIFGSEGGRRNGDRSGDSLRGLMLENQGVSVTSKKVPPFVDDIRREMGIDGDSHAITSVIAKLYDFSHTRAPVLLVGQRGVGKKRLARFLHRITTSSSVGYLLISSETLIENDLNSFNVSDYLADTEAERQKTIIFDRPELLPNILCNSILARFFAQGKTPRTRIILTVDSQALSRFSFTLSPENRDALRSGLISVPPLCERYEDVRRHILMRLRDLNRTYGVVKRIATNTLDYLCICEYPQNFYSLYAFIDKLYDTSNEVISCDESLISKELTKGTIDNFLPELDEGFRLEKFLGCVRREIIWSTLERANYNQTVCAESLGVTPQAINKFLHSQKFYKSSRKRRAKKRKNAEDKQGD
jgi:Nif-specific regulatory protein